MSMGLVADVAGTAVKPAKKRIQKRVRQARLDKRTTLVRRSLELRAMFTAELMKVGADVESPFVSEVAAEQARRVVGRSAVDVVEAVGLGPDLSELGDEELERLKVYLREVGGDGDG